uniref:Ig-like domain-containing protein n=1 Tax=Sander lucioperca TaxID=283035 RepID=A0A8C9X5E9_SANLU
VEVQSGGDVTLMCSNISTVPTQTEWFRVINRTKPSCVSSMYGSDSKPSFCDGFQNRFEMSSNISTVFLKIKRVDLSDSGLYFCGFYIDGHTVIASATHLKVQGKIVVKPQRSVSIILTVYLTFIVTVIVWLTQLQSVCDSVCDSEYSDLQDLGSDELNYAALNFQAKPKRSRRPASEREMDPHVVYAATR